MSSSASAAPVIAAGSGHANPALVYTFDDQGLAEYTTVTTQYPGLTLNSLYQRNSPVGFPNFEGPHISNTIDLGTAFFTRMPLILDLDSPVTDVTLAFSSGGTWTFNSYLNGVFVETTGPVETAYFSPTNYYGFTNTLIDRIVISNPISTFARFDNLAVGTAAAVPEIHASSGLIPLSLLGFLLMLMADRRRLTAES